MPGCVAVQTALPSTFLLSRFASTKIVSHVHDACVFCIGLSEKINVKGTIRIEPVWTSVRLPFWFYLSRVRFFIFRNLLQVHGHHPCWCWHMLKCWAYIVFRDVRYSTHQALRSGDILVNPFAWCEACEGADWEVKILSMQKIPSLIVLKSFFDFQLQEPEKTKWEGGAKRSMVLGLYSYAGRVGITNATKLWELFDGVKFQSCGNYSTASNLHMPHVKHMARLNS